jgi:hypothetical protein
VGGTLENAFEDFSKRGRGLRDEVIALGPQISRWDFAAAGDPKMRRGIFRLRFEHDAHNEADSQSEQEAGHVFSINAFFIQHEKTPDGYSAKKIRGSAATGIFRQ